MMRHNIGHSTFVSYITPFALGSFHEFVANYRIKMAKKRPQNKRCSNMIGLEVPLDWSDQ